MLLCFRAKLFRKNDSSKGLRMLICLIISYHFFYYLILLTGLIFFFCTNMLLYHANLFFFLPWFWQFLRSVQICTKHSSRGCRGGGDVSFNTCITITKFVIFFNLFLEKVNFVNISQKISIFSDYKKSRLLFDQ